MVVDVAAAEAEKTQIGAGESLGWRMLLLLLPRLLWRPRFQI